MMPFRCGKILPPRGSLQREFADQRALLPDFLGSTSDCCGGRSTSMPDPSTARVIPCAASAPRCAALSMPDGEAAGDGKPASGEIFGEFMGGIPALGSGIAAADDGQLRIVQGVHVADDIERDRMPFRRAQQGGIARVRERHDMMAGIFEPGALGGVERRRRGSTGIRALPQDIPARSRDASDASTMPRADPKISSAFARAGNVERGRARERRPSSRTLRSVALRRIIGRAPRHRRPPRRSCAAMLQICGDAAGARAAGCRTSYGFWTWSRDANESVASMIRP